jgi:hypothetical protein
MATNAPKNCPDIAGNGHNAPLVGDKVLITTNEWFFAPDGEMYRAVFGTIMAILTAEETLGVKTNSKSTNWYVQIGRMTVAGCQVHYCIKTDEVSQIPPNREIEHDGKLNICRQDRTRIYVAD